MCTAIGVLVLAAVWLGPLPRIAGSAFWAHMTMHMAVVAVAAPLVAIGLAGGRWDPVRRIPFAFPPIPVSLVELAIVWVWHAPLLHHAARHSRIGLVLEQSTFLASGLLVWLSVLGGDAHHRIARRATGVVALLLTSMHMTLLGALLALAGRPLYEHHASHSWLTPLQDQHLGGAIMLVVGGAVYLAGGLWLTARLLAGADASGRRRV
jgi:putative membrane protein